MSERIKTPQEQLEDDLRRPMIGLHLTMADFSDAHHKEHHHGGDLDLRSDSEDTDDSQSNIEETLVGNQQVGFPPRPSTRGNHVRHYGRRKKVVFGIVAAGLLSAACGVIASNGSESEAALPLITTTAFPESTLATSTSTSAPAVTEVICSPNQDGQFEVLAGQTLTRIAKACGVAVGELVEWNDLENPNDIDAGQLLIVEMPAPTTSFEPTTEVSIETTTVPETTIAVPEEPILPVEESTIPAETVPLETLPPETAPPAPVNDGTLTRVECVSKGGTPTQLPADGRGPWKVFKDWFNLTDYQVGRIFKSTIPRDYHLEDVTASTAENPVWECKPADSVINEVAPVAAPPTSTATG